VSKVIHICSQLLPLVMAALLSPVGLRGLSTPLSMPCTDHHQSLKKLTIIAVSQSVNQ